MTTIKRLGAVLAAAVVLFAAGCASDGGKESRVGAYLDDAAVTARVKTAIFNEKTLKVTDISVTTENNVVHLTGSVKTPAERRKAGEVASKVQGVRRVINELTLKK